MESLRNHPVILPVYLPSTIFSFTMSALSPIFPLYVMSFDMSYGIVGVVLACTGLGMLFGDLPAGICIRRFGIKPTMIAGVGTIIFLTIALFWARSIPEVIINRLLAGFGMALYAVSRHTYMAENIVLENRGKAIALFGGLNRIGRFAGPAIGGFIGAAYGLRLPMLLIGIVQITALVAIILFLQSEGVTQREKEAEISLNGNIFFATLKAHYKILAGAGLGQLFGRMIRAGRGVIIPLYGASMIGLDPKDIGIIMSIAAAVEMLLFYPAGIIMDRYGRKFAVVPCFFLQAIGMLMIPFSDSFIGLSLATILIGFGNGLGAGVMMILGADLSPDDSRGEFLGIWRLIGDCGGTGAPLLVGGIADMLSLPMSAWALSGAGMVAVFAFLFLVPETLKK